MTGNALLLSIRPEYAEKIFNQTKTVELRRVYPKQIGKGDLVIIYEPTPVQALTGMFKVDQIVEYPLEELWDLVKDKAGINREDFDEYYRGATSGVGIFFSECWKLPEPIKLQILKEREPNFHPPQGFRYLSKDRQPPLLLSEFMEDVGYIYYTQTELDL